MSLFQKILFTLSLLFGIFSLVDIIVPTKFQECKIIDNQTQIVKSKHGVNYLYYFHVKNNSIRIDYDQYDVFNTTKDSVIMIKETILFKNVKAYNYHGYTSNSFSALFYFLLPLLLIIISTLSFLLKDKYELDGLVLAVTMLLTLTIFIKFL